MLAQVKVRGNGSDVTDSTPITSRDQLIAWIEGGARPQDQFRIGTEHEKIPFHRIDHSPVPYDGLPARGQGGVRTLLEGLQKRLDWAPVNDRDRTSSDSSMRRAGRGFRLSPAVNSNFPARRSTQSIKPTPSSTAIFRRSKPSPRL